MTPKSQRASDAVRIEQLVRDLVGDDDSPEALMREHLEGARFYLLGSMPAEYALNLKLAEGILPEIKDHDLRTRIRELIRRRD